MERIYIILITSLIMFACSTSSNDPVPVDFPEHAVLRAEAEGTHENLEIECFLYLLISQVEEEPRTPQTVYATMGGEARRTVLNEHGIGTSFFGESFDSIKIDFHNTDEIIISSRLHEPTGESRFWDELLRFDGEMTAEQQWEGTWNCFPVYVPGDSIGIIKGTWLIESAE